MNGDGRLRVSVAPDLEYEYSSLSGVRSGRIILRFLAPVIGKHLQTEGPLPQLPMDTGAFLSLDYAP